MSVLYITCLAGIRRSQKTAWTFWDWSWADCWYYHRHPGWVHHTTMRICLYKLGASRRTVEERSYSDHCDSGSWLPLVLIPPFNSAPFRLLPSILPSFFPFFPPSIFIIGDWTQDLMYARSSLWITLSQNYIPSVPRPPFFGDRVSFCIPDWSGTLYVDEYGIDLLKILPPSLLFTFNFGTGSHWPQLTGVTLYPRNLWSLCLGIQAQCSSVSFEVHY